MCADCVNVLPAHIKFELWRTYEDGFCKVHKDAMLFLTNRGAILDTITYPKEDNEKTILDKIKDWF